MFSTQVKMKVAQSCPTVWDTGILQTRILEWVAVPFSRVSSQTRDWTLVSHIVDKHFTVWATREVGFSIFGWKEYNQSDFDVDHLVMSMCKVFSCVVGRECLLWPVCSLGKTLLAFSASFNTPKPNFPVIPGISWHPTFAFQFSMMKRTSLLGVSSKTLKDELHRSVGAQYATGEEWRNNSRKNEETEWKQKQCPVVDVTSDGSKVWCSIALEHELLIHESR